MKQFLSKTWSLYQPFRGVMGVMFVFMIIAQALSLVSPYLYGRIIDGVISQQPLRHVLLIAALAFAVYAIQEIISYFGDVYELRRFDYAVPRHLAVNTLRTFFGFSIGQHNNQNSGVKRSVITRGEHALNSLAFMLAYELIPLLLLVVFTIGALLYISWVLGSIVLVGVILFVGISIYLNNVLKDDMKRVRDLWIENDKMQGEIIQNVELVQVNAQEKRVTEEYGIEYDFIGKQAQKMWTRYQLFAHVRGIVVVLVRFMVIAVGILFVYQGKYTPGYLVVFLTWSANVFSHLASFGQIHRRSLELHASVQKYYDLLEMPCDVVAPKHPVTPAIEGRIEFKGVTFRYPSRDIADDDDVKSESKKKKKTAGPHDALTKVDLTIEPGQRVAFVGHSGAGKSTIAQLMLRAFDPTKGKILIDGTDLRNFDLGYYRSHIGMVEQDVKLFDNTLRYNIIFGRSDTVTDEELEAVSRSASIEQFRHRLEKGFDTLIGEKGVKLSGGERQRVGIARALIKQPKILIFDEATSSLDTENEQLIRQSIESASVGRTTIIIAHRLSTIRDADKIFVVDGGAIVGSGTHDELMQQCDPYKNLINKQMVSIV